MGACSFIAHGWGKDAKEAYEMACKDAVRRFGNDPYNGSISTTDGFFMQGLDSPRMTEKAIDRAIKNAISRSEKREKCGCIELKGKALKQAKAKCMPEKDRKKKGIRFFIFAGMGAE
jgi:hypothetical protein